MERTCQTEGCAKPHAARGFCATHYASERYSGRLQPLPTVPHEVLFWSYVDKDGPNGCWIWTGRRKPAGYGTFGRNRTGIKYAHRHAWELLRGPIPEGYEVDHLCRVTSCVNPDHLEPVTPTENRRRAAAARPPGMPRQFYGRKPRALATECHRGHPYDEQNTAYYANGKRRCRSCHRENEHARLDRQREAS